MSLFTHPCLFNTDLYVRYKYIIIKTHYINKLLILFITDGCTANFCFSPLSVYSGLSLAFAGSSGETRNQFASFLRLAEDERGVREAAEIISELSAQPSGHAMKQSVGVFLDEHNALREAYEVDLHKHFGVKPQKV